MEQTDNKGEDNIVTEEEIQWMISKRPLIHSEEQLIVDYGVCNASKKKLSAYPNNKLQLNKSIHLTRHD